MIDEIPTEPETYAFNPTIAAARADGIAGPDGVKLKLDMNRVALLQKLGMTVLAEREAAFDEDGKLFEYAGYLDDLILCLSVCALSDEDVGRLRLGGPFLLDFVTNTWSFFDQRNVKLGDDQFKQWEQAYLELIQDALLSEAEPVRIDDADDTVGGTPPGKPD
jgi:hypothetical protein